MKKQHQMKPIAYFSSEVVVAAMLNWDSPAGKVLQEVFRGNLKPLFFEDTLNKYHEILRNPEFNMPEDAVNTVIDEMDKIGFTDNRYIYRNTNDSVALILYYVVLEKNESKTNLVYSNGLFHRMEKVTPQELLQYILIN